MTLLLFFSIIIMSKKYILLMKNGLHLCEFCPRSRLTSRTDSTTKRKVKHCWRRALINWIIRICTCATHMGIACRVGWAVSQKTREKEEKQNHWIRYKIITFECHICFVVMA